jgi:hypothetical protein
MSSRRTFLAFAAGGVAAPLAGCLGDGTDDGGSDDPDDLPVRDLSVPLAHDLETYADSITSAGVSKDGIPSIDTPKFGDVAAGDDAMDPEDTVFGVEFDGEARAYPQHILVQHEIVNDEFDGNGVAITYCPLAESVLGFERSDVEFGVDGRLINSNLIMYDRASESLWPQILGTCVEGELIGNSLNEFPVVWTTWKRWKDAYPDTWVLVEDTGYARDYDSDPYDDNSSQGGYYRNSSLVFPTMHEDDRHPSKDKVIGARSVDGAVAFGWDALREQSLLETSVNGVPYLAVYDPAFDSAHVYRGPNDEFERAGERYERSDGETYAPADLPLRKLNAFEVMWFAWVGYYPDTALRA